MTPDQFRTALYNDIRTRCRVEFGPGEPLSLAKVLGSYIFRRISLTCRMKKGKLTVKNMRWHDLESRRKRGKERPHSRAPPVRDALINASSELFTVKLQDRSTKQVTMNAKPCAALYWS